MFNYYEPTETEKWIEEMYLSNGILSPGDITIKNLSHCLSIPVYFAPGITEEMVRDRHFEDFFVIYLNSSNSPEKQKQSFLHELCHGLRHVGNQSKMPIGLQKMQEEQAEQFVLLASMPFFMIRQMDLPRFDQDIIRILTYEFGVTHELAERRLNQIKNRIYYGQARKEFVSKLQCQYKKAEPQPYSAATLRLLDQLQRQTIRKGE